MLFFLALAVLIGGAVPIQTAANAELRRQLHSPFLATLVNSSLGALIIACVLLFAGSSLQVQWAEALNSPWWSFLGGPLGFVILLLALLTMPILGGVGTALSMTLGSVCTGMIIDTLGLLNSPVHAFNLQRALGLLLSLLGLALMLRLYQFLSGRRPSFKMAAVPGVILGLAAGSSQIIQTAVNTELSRHLGSTIPTGLWCMGCTMCIIWCCLALRRESPLALRRLQIGRSFWILSGGLCGALYLIVNAFLLPRIGAGSLVILNIAGQMAAAMVIDNFGLFGAQKRQVSLMETLGIVIVFAGVALIKQG